MSEFADLQRNRKWDQILPYLRKARLEQITDCLANFIKTFDHFRDDQDYNSILEIISIISNYNFETLAEEMKEGITILLQEKRIKELLSFYYSYLDKNNRNIEQSQLYQALNLIALNPKVLENRDDKDKLTGIIAKLENKQISHNTWHLWIENYTKAGLTETALYFLKFCPIFSSHTEIFYKSYLTHNLQLFEQVFNITCQKFNNRISDEVTFQGIFNSIVDILVTQYEVLKPRINEELVQSIIVYITKEFNLKLKDKVIEDLLILRITHKAHFDEIKTYLMIFNFQITQDLVYKVIKKYYEQSDITAIHCVLLMAKQQINHVKIDLTCLDDCLVKDLFDHLIKRVDLGKLEEKQNQRKAFVNSYS